jgi:hypothetical protein
VEEQQKREFVELAERLANASDPAEQERLKEELARLTFGEQGPPVSSRA